MTAEEVKERIAALQNKHHITGDDLSDLSQAEMYEVEVEELIVAYCEERGYLVNGFPTEKRNLDDEEFDDEYFCTERFRLYLDRLAVEKDDVADLLYYYQSSFWPDSFETRQHFLDQIKVQLESGRFYDVEL